MPIGAPSYRPEPKSAWSPPAAPIAAITAAESPATGSLSAGRFHTLPAGKIGQPGAVGRGCAGPEPPRDRAKAAAQRSEQTAFLVTGRRSLADRGGGLAR